MSSHADAASAANSVDCELVVVTTGSQGEPLAALRRMAYREHRQVTLHKGDTIVFTLIPGNERAINDTVDRLMPVHGDHKRIRLHAELAQAVGIPDENIFRGDNGLPLDIDKDGARFGDRVRAGMVFVDGIELGDLTETALRDRRELSSDGIMFVSTVSAQDGKRSPTTRSSCAASRSPTKTKRPSTASYAKPSKPPSTAPPTTTSTKSTSSKSTCTTTSPRSSTTSCAVAR